MGVDFGICAVKKKGEEIEHLFLKEIPHLSYRYHYYWPLFKDRIKIIESLANSKLDLDFYEKADKSSYGDCRNANTSFNPLKVKNTLLIILDTIKKHKREFPFFYWICFKNKSCSDTQDLYIEDQIVYIKGGWAQCYYILKDREVDLRKQKSEIVVNRVFTEKLNRRWINQKGGKEVLYIKKESFYDYYKDSIGTIVSICEYAIKNKYYIQGYLC